MRWIWAIALMHGCHARVPQSDQTTPRAPNPDEDTSNGDSPQNQIGMHLSAVQLDCRSSKMVEIGQSNKAFGARCSGNTMSVALSTFDLGSFDGLLEARQLNGLITSVCLCRATPCEQGRMTSLQAKVERLSGDRTKAEREGVLRMTNALQSHECLDTATGVEIYKSGYTCGLVTGGRSEEMRATMEQGFLRVFTNDEERARSLAATCWDSFKPPDGSE